MVLQGSPYESRIWGFLDGDSNPLRITYSCIESGKDEIPYTPEKVIDTKYNLEYEYECALTFPSFLG